MGLSFQNLPEGYDSATVSAMTDELQITIRRAASDAELRVAAEIMGTTDPWVKLGRTPEMIYPNLASPQLEVYVGVANETVVGVITVAISIPLIKGYIGALAIAREWQNRGVGTRLLKYAEARILRESPNVFICVSTFNGDARRLYERHGYTLVGELSDYTLAGHGELLLRKTIGPWSTFKPADPVER